MSTLFSMLLFVLTVFFYLVLFAFMLRMLFQLFKANANNPVAITIANITDIAVKPLRDYMPRTRFIDLSTLSCWLVIDVIKYTFIVYLDAGTFLTPAQYLYIVPADFVMQALSIIFYATLFYTVINFVAPGLQSPGMDTLRALSEPVLNVVRRRIPPSGGFDFAPVIVLVLSKFCQIGITQVIPPTYFY